MKHPNTTPPRRATTPEDAADVDVGTIAGKAFARRFVKVDPMPKDRMTTTPILTIGSARAST
jgi:hypothetical protein